MRNGVANLLSSPSTIGLFGGLLLNQDKAQQSLGIYDLSRQQIKKGKVYRGWEIYRSRHRMLRYERMPERLEDQINLLEMLLRASLRIGRPLHLFRGLPTTQRDFFYSDTLPVILQNLLGGSSLRLEEIPEAIDKLTFAQDLLNVPS